MGEGTGLRNTVEVVVVFLGGQCGGVQSMSVCVSLLAAVEHETKG